MTKLVGEVGLTDIWCEQSLLSNPELFEGPDCPVSEPPSSVGGSVVSPCEKLAFYLNQPSHQHLEG